MMLSYPETMSLIDCKHTSQHDERDYELGLLLTTEQVAILRQCAKQIDLDPRLNLYGSIMTYLCVKAN